MFETIAFAYSVDLREPGHCPGAEAGAKTPAPRLDDETAPEQSRMLLECRWQLTDASAGQPRLVAQWATADD